jgi:hypothetical protein
MWLTDVSDAEMQKTDVSGKVVLYHALRPVPACQRRKKRDVTPAQAGAHLERAQNGEISGWIPACAGMTPWVKLVLCYFHRP